MRRPFTTHGSAAPGRVATMGPTRWIGIPLRGPLNLEPGAIPGFREITTGPKDH